jgi:PKD repeat protein
LNGSLLNNSQPTIEAQFEDLIAGVNIFDVFIFIDGINQTQNATITDTSITFIPQSPLSQGNHTIYLEVSDVIDNQNSTSWQFRLDSLNPTANAGNNLTVFEDDIINFNGNASSDENAIINYTWDFGDGTFGYGVNPAHFYSLSGSYDVTLTVWDSALNSDTDTITVNVENFNPIANSGSDKTSNEGILLYFNGDNSFDTQSDLPSLNYTWYFEDGTVLYGIIVNYTFWDNGNYVVTLEVTDDDNDFSNDTLNVFINNLAPTADIGGPYFGFEGTQVDFSASANDPGIDTFTYDWDFDDSDGFTYTDAVGSNPNWTWPDDFSGTVYLRVTDDDGGIGYDSTSVTISNIAPAADCGGPYIGYEGVSLELSGSAEDLGSDSFSFDWDLDNDGQYDDFTGENSDWTWPDNGIYTIGLRVTDDDGGVGTNSTIITIYNLAPTANAGNTLYGNEGADMNFTGNHTDSGSLDTVSYLWDFGDGTTSSDENPSHVYSDDGIYTINLTVTDKDGGVGYDTTLAIVYNTAPQIQDVGGELTAVEDIEFTFVIIASDVAGDTITFTDDSDLFVINPATGAIIFTPTNNDVGLVQVTITATDDDGGIDNILLLINVQNENDPPVLDHIPSLTANEDEGFTYTVTADDVDEGDVLTFSDNSELFDIDSDSGQISFTPTNDQVGIYTIIITVTDSVGAQDTMQVTLTIVNTNDAPILNGIPNQEAVVGERFRYQATAVDIDGDLLSFSDNSQLLTIFPTTGNISFIPREGDEGTYTINITVSDGNGGQDSKTMTLEIINNEEPKETSDWFSLLPILLMIIIVIVVLLLILLMLTRRKDKEEQEALSQRAVTEELPPPEPEDLPPPEPIMETPPPPDIEEIPPPTLPDEVPPPPPPDPLE